MQVHSAKVLLDPYSDVSQRISNLCLAALQLSAVGCSSTVGTRHSIRPCDMARKCAQFAAEAGLSAEQLWAILEDGRRKAGSTGVDGIGHLAKQALPSVSRNELAKLSALLLVETDEFSTSGQVNSCVLVECTTYPCLLWSTLGLWCGLWRNRAGRTRIWGASTTTSVTVRIHGASAEGMSCAAD